MLTVNAYNSCPVNIKPCTVRVFTFLFCNKHSVALLQADEREQKARDFMRAEMRYHRAVEDLKTKQLQIQDHQKKYQEMQIK